MKLRSLVLAALTCSFPAVALAESLPDVLLAAIDVPLTHEVIGRVGLTEAHAATRLADVSAKRYVRLRAVSSLPFFGTPTARALLERTAAEDRDVEVRIQAVTSLARGFGPGDPVGVLAALNGLAKGAPPKLAEAIAVEIGRLNTPPAAPSATAR